MITVTYNSVSYECTTALKGADYIHLLDANNQMIVSFDGVSDFTGFTISGGSWTTPTSADDCYLATVGDDGVLRKGSHKCSDIGTIETTLGSLGTQVTNNEKALCRTNLLDNWYFPNAVNQRGETSWGSSDYGQTLDRWTKSGTGYSITYTEGTGITFSRLTSGGYIRQYIDKRTYNAIKGKKITISVLCDSLSSGDSFRIVFCKHNTGGYHYISVENTGITSLTVDGPTEDYPVRYGTTFRPYFSLQLMDSCTATIRAVKLEVGENQTLARQVNGSWVLNDVPNYSEQLMRCKRFYQIIQGGVFTGIVQAYSATTYGIYATIQIQVDMCKDLTDPGISYGSGPVGHLYNSTSDLTITDVLSVVSSRLGTNDPENGSYYVGCISPNLTSSDLNKLAIVRRLQVMLSTEIL